MDDFADVHDSALAFDIGNDSGEDSSHTGHDELQILQQPPQEAQSAMEHSTPSQDRDFQSQVQVVVRSRAGAGQSLVPEPKPKNVETEHSREGAVKCPECNHPAKRKDVRRIWSKSVVVLDTVEKEEAYARVKKEQEIRMRCEKDLAYSRMAYEMLKSEMTKLQKKFDRQRALKRRYRAEVQRLKLTNPETDIVKKFLYVAHRTIPVSLTGMGMAHYLSYRPDEEMLVCSRQINAVHGIARVSMRDYSNNLNDFIPIHSQAIRDVQCYNIDSFSFANKSLVLTASMDKTLKISSVASQQVVLTGSLDQASFGGDLELKSDYRVTGGQPVSSMSRTTIFSRLNGAVQMAAGSVGMSYVWYDASNSSSSSTSTFAAPSETASQVALAHGDGSLERVVLESTGSKVGLGRPPIKDIKPVVVGLEEFVVALSDKELELYRWTDVTPHGDGNESDEMDEYDSGSGPEKEEEDDPGNKGKRRRVDDHGEEDESRVASGTDAADMTIDDTFTD
ncbi:RING finger and WD repeat domain-containing protein 3 [Mortierella alpina]|nr:RING finger and WD repeat domain-containing protein 3 [Mortierella alpina]